MTILALEFSSDRRSVALADGAGTVLAEAVEETGVRGASAFALIERVLAMARLSRDRVAVVAVGVGPGSYTGIRAAIAVAQGWQLARGVNVLGIGSVESLAAQARRESLFGRVNFLVDAQRGEFYLAQWEIAGVGSRELAPLHIVTAAEVERRQAAGELCAGPDLDRRLFPTAATVAALAAGRSGFVTGDRLEPIYLRATSFIKAPPGRLV